MLNAGNAIAATVSAPLGSYLGGIVGWRGAFFFVVPLALLALVWQWVAMPSLPPRGRPGRGNVFRLLGRAQVALGMTAILLLFMGQFALFTYLRPFLETVTGLTVAELSLAFLAVGLAGVAGTWCISRLLGRRLLFFLIGIPAGDGGHCRPADRCRPLAARRRRPPRPPGSLWHRRAGWMGHMACPRSCTTRLKQAEAFRSPSSSSPSVRRGRGGLMFDVVGWWSPHSPRLWIFDGLRGLRTGALGWTQSD